MESWCEDALQDDRFLLLQAIGRGGMGRVYRAFDRSEQRLVALKVPRDPEQPGPSHPLSGEFDTWSRLRHPNIVEAYELGCARRGPISPGTPYLVLEHVECGPAHRRLRPGHIDPALTEALADQVLRALDHVHGFGFVHRDLKPDNVLLETGHGRPPRFKLTDFGLATRMGHAGAAGTVSGSLAYVSPEALLGLPIDARADLYGLGILLYQLATGELPVASNSAEALLRWHLSGPPADPARVRPRMSLRFARFIRRLTERDREARPASAGEALQILGGSGEALVAARPRETVGRARRAQLRLALDAARLGSGRVFRLPESTAEADALKREVAVWTQVRGLGFYRLTGAEPCAGGGLGVLVLRLLSERRHDAAGCMRRFRLQRSLPLALLGGRPLLDPPVRAADEKRARLAARDLAAFLAHCARSRPIVLCVERPALSDPLVRALTVELTVNIDGGGANSAPQALLLILETASARGKIEPPCARLARSGTEAHIPSGDSLFPRRISGGPRVCPQQVQAGHSK